jgi:hypothetical protein
MAVTYYKRGNLQDNRYDIFKRVNAGGDRHMATGMSESFASLVVRLLNEDDARRQYALEDAGRPTAAQD